MTPTVCAVPAGSSAGIGDGRATATQVPGQRRGGRGKTADAARHKHSGQWVLVDSKFQLLSIGAALYKGTSPRAALDATARGVLVPRLHAALLGDEAGDRTVRYFGRAWRTSAVPVLSPLSRTPVAVLGCYRPPEASPPEPPLVGAWEWHVTPPGPDQRMRVFWSPAQFDLYGIPRPGSGRPDAPAQSWWEGPQWLDELVFDSDRAEMRRVLDALVHARTDGLFIHSYRVRSPATGRVQRLRLAGRSRTDSTGTWLRGISMRMADEDAAAPAPAAAVLDAAFTLSADPLCAIDPAYEHIYMTSANFGELGIELPPDRHLPKMAHPEDLAALRAFLREASERPDQTIAPVTVRLAASRGRDWKRLAITGTGMRLSPSAPGPHVLCRITPAGA